MRGAKSQRWRECKQVFLRALEKEGLTIFQVPFWLFVLHQHSSRKPEILRDSHALGISLPYCKSSLPSSSCTSLWPGQAWAVPRKIQSKTQVGRSLELLRSFDVITWIVFSFLPYSLWIEDPLLSLTSRYSNSLLGVSLYLDSVGRFNYQIIFSILKCQQKKAQWMPWLCLKWGFQIRRFSVRGFDKFQEQRIKEDKYQECPLREALR